MGSAMIINYLIAVKRGKLQKIQWKASTNINYVKCLGDRIHYCTWNIDLIMDTAQREEYFSA